MRSICNRIIPSSFCLNVLFLVVFSCSSVNEKELEQVHSKVMDNEMWNPVISLTQKEKKIVNARSQKLYKNNNTLALLVGDVEVDFFNEDGNRMSVLFADSARINERTNDLNANGNVFVVSDSGYTLSTNKLSWNNSYKMIMSEDSVTFTTMEGDTLHGVGFESDSDLEEWRIFKPYGIARKGI